MIISLVPPYEWCKWSFEICQIHAKEWHKIRNAYKSLRCTLLEIRHDHYKVMAIKTEWSIYIRIKVVHSSESHLRNVRFSNRLKQSFKCYTEGISSMGLYLIRLFIWLVLLFVAFCLCSTRRLFNTFLESKLIKQMTLLWIMNIKIFDVCFENDVTLLDKRFLCRSMNILRVINGHLFTLIFHNVSLIDWGC